MKSAKRSSTPTPTASPCQVDVGQGSLLHFGRGVPNARVGIKVPCALVGAELPPGADGKPFMIKLGKLRGVESQGMSWRPACELTSDDHGGLLELPADTAVGLEIPATCCGLMTRC